MTGSASQNDTPQSITLHSSWFGVGASLLGVFALLALAVVALVVGSVNVVSVVIAAVALIAAVVVIVDMPIATRFDADGITRSTLLRQHRLRWDQIDHLDRIRRGRRRSEPSKRSATVAVRGIRQVLLVDRMEGSVEHAQLRSIVGPDVVEAYFGKFHEPPADRTPTWVGRRARWAPDDAPAS